MAQAVLDDTRAERIRRVRAFNRFYTAYVGGLGDGHLASPYGLTEVRVLYELAQAERTEVADLRVRLGVDPSYLSRTLARFEKDGLLVRERSTEDGRRQRARLTGAGQAIFGELNERAAVEVGDWLDRLPDQRQRAVVSAMDRVRAALGPEPSDSGPAYQLRPFRAGDYGWVISRNGAIYAEQFGWDASYEALVARIVADYADNHDPERENAWIAELDGDPVGCVFCVRNADDPDHTAQLRLLLVEPAARGLGIGRRLVDECVEFARAKGNQRLVLWTNDVLESARRIYQGAGFQLESSYPHHSFGTDLTGQYWGLQL